MRTLTPWKALFAVLIVNVDATWPGCVGTLSWVCSGGGVPGGHSPLDPSLECSREASPEFSLETNPWALQPLLLGDSVYPLRKVGGAGLQF